MSHLRKACGVTRLDLGNEEVDRWNWCETKSLREENSGKGKVPSITKVCIYKNSVVMREICESHRKLIYEWYLGHENGTVDSAKGDAS